MSLMPKTEEEIAKEAMWPAGEYGFEILEASDETSKAGNPMIKLKLAIYNADGDQRIIFDYLMEKVAYKLRHCATVCGLLGKDEVKPLNAIDFIGKTGNLKLRQGTPKDGHPAKNEIQDYIVPKDGAPVSVPVAAKNGSAPIVEDQIPWG